MTVVASFDIGEVNFAYTVGTVEKLITMKHFNVKSKKSQNVIESCEAVSKILSQEDFSACDRVIIEQQMSKNMRAQRLSQHVWTWFSLMYPETKPTFISARVKTDRGLSYAQRKKVAVESARNILTERGDDFHLDYMSSLPKQDDVADALIQMHTWFNKHRKN